MTWVTKPAPKPKPKIKIRVSLKHGKRLKRSRMKQRNAKRKGSAFPKRRDYEFQGFVRAQRCLVYGRFTPRDSIYGDGRRLVWHKCIGPAQVCHVKSRGTGGDDRKNVVAMCAAAHDEQHTIGIPAFEKRWGVKLKAEAERLDRAYVQSGGAAPSPDPHKEIP